MKGRESRRLGRGSSGVWGLGVLGKVNIHIGAVHKTGLAWWLHFPPTIRGLAALQSPSFRLFLSADKGGLSEASPVTSCAGVDGEVRRAEVGTPPPGLALYRYLRGHISQYRQPFLPPLLLCWLLGPRYFFGGFEAAFQGWRADW